MTFFSELRRCCAQPAVSDSVLNLDINGVSRKCQLIIWALSILITSNAHADDSSIESLDLSLSEAAQQAVDNGVALTFICEFANLKTIVFVPWVTERKQHRFVLTRHELSDRYIVRQDKLQTPYLFRSLAHATEFMTEQAVELFDSYSDLEQQHHVRISLSKFDLPGPMRLNAFISNEWDLDSGWIEWVSEN